MKEKKVNYKSQKEINSTIENIKMIEEQIKDFEKNKPLFFKKSKSLDYEERIKNLEQVKRYLYKRLEYLIDLK